MAVFYTDSNKGWQTHFDFSNYMFPAASSDSDMPRLVIDLDGTLALEDNDLPYPDRAPNLEVVARLREYREMGFEIAIFSARNMRTYNNSVGHINAHTLPTIVAWLRRHEVPFDEIHVGKPWCGDEGFYVDDRAIRPSEFASLSREEIENLLRMEAEASSPKRVPAE